MTSTKPEQAVLLWSQADAPKRLTADTARQSLADAYAVPADYTPAKRPLTDKERSFVAHFLVDMNATQAYLKSHPGVAYTTARTEGARLLANPCIQDAIAETRAKVAGKLELSLERILLVSRAAAERPVADPTGFDWRRPEMYARTRQGVSTSMQRQVEVNSCKGTYERGF